MQQKENASAEQTTHKDVYQMVTDRIIDALSNGTVPWQKPWRESGLPRNAITNRPYRGINMLLLNSLGYEHNLFLTYNQVNKELNGKIKQGEHGHIVTYWNTDKNKTNNAAAENADDDSGVKKKAFLRYYTVFNVSQCENIPEKYLQPQREVRVIPTCEEVVAGMPKPPEIKHKQNKAFYDALLDFINMPKKTSFTSDEGYYSTLFHELIHSTGHHTRLARKNLIEMAEYGSTPYSHEELVAEIGTCFLQSFTGLECEFENSAAYIFGWLKVFEHNKSILVSAASMAQKAVDFILNITPETEEIEHSENSFV